MTTLTISLPDEKAEQLKNKAAQRGVPLEEFLATAVDDLLVRSDSKFEVAAERVLNKNNELYNRLA